MPVFLGLDSFSQMLKGSRVWSCLKRRFPASSRGARVSVDSLMYVLAPASLTLHLPYPLKCPRQTHINSNFADEETRVWEH